MLVPSTSFVSSMISEATCKERHIGQSREGFTSRCVGRDRPAEQLPMMLDNAFLLNCPCGCRYRTSSGVIQILRMQRNSSKALMQAAGRNILHSVRIVKGS